MQGKNHVALALAVPLAWSYLAGPEITPVSVFGWGGLVLGSLAPDIDGEGSICYLGNFLPRHITPKPVIRLLNWAGRTVSSGIRAIFGHRKALHWPVWGVLLAWLGFHTGQEWLIWFGIGYVLHILGDMLTKSGVPLFGPLIPWDISLTPMVTGKFVESFFGICLWAFVIWRLAVDMVPISTWLVQQIHRFV